MLERGSSQREQHAVVKQHINVVHAVRVCCRGGDGNQAAQYLILCDTGNHRDRGWQSIDVESRAGGTDVARAVSYRHRKIVWAIRKICCGCKGKRTRGYLLSIQRDY